MVSSPKSVDASCSPHHSVNERQANNIDELNANTYPVVPVEKNVHHGRWEKQDDDSILKLEALKIANNCCSTAVDKTDGREYVRKWSYNNKAGAQKQHMK